MKTNPNQNPDPAPPSDPAESALRKLARQQRRLRWLTGLTIGLWLLAVAAAIGVLGVYMMFVAPKERQILAQYGARTAAHASGMPSPHTEFLMTYVATKGVLVVAASVLILACGTMTTLLLVQLTRRVTLDQINHSLAQISAQLLKLEAASR